MAAAAQEAPAAATEQQEQQEQPQQQREQPQQPQEDQWQVNKPVERRSEALTAELQDCYDRFWTWVTCGGPAARIRQLYITGRLSKCWDEYTRFKNCLVGKLNPENEITVLPGPHPVWHIRTRKEAAAFWKQHYAHLGAGATQSEDNLRPDVTSQPAAG